MLLSDDVVNICRSMYGNQWRLQSVLLDDVIDYKSLWLRSGFLSGRRRRTMHLT